MLKLFKILIFFQFFTCIFAQNTTRIGTLIFDNNIHFTDSELESFIFSKPGNVFSEQQLNLDVKNIINKYNESGFIDASINSVSKDFSEDSLIVHLAISISEGSQTFIGKIEFTGNRVYNDAALKRFLTHEEGDIFNTSVLNNDINEILNFYERNGYSFVQISISDISVYNDNGINKLQIKINVDENERLLIDNIQIEGNETTDDKVIIRELKLGKDRVIGKADLIEMRQKLENTGFFETVETPKIYKYKDKTVLQIKLTEGNTNTFDGIIGYVPPAENEEKGFITGFVNLSMRNLFGSGRSTAARWEKLQESTQELEIGYTEPWFLDYPIDIHAGFTQRIQDSTYIKRDLNVRFDLTIFDQLTLSLLGGFERVIPEENILATISGINIFNSRTLDGGIELAYDTRDYIYNPTKGILYKTNYTLGLKKVYNWEAFNDPEITENINVHYLRADLDFFHSFFRRQTSLVGLHGVNITAPRIETADLFRLGGINTIRGYREHQFLVSKAAWANIEMRYALTRKTFASVFYDPGYYFTPVNNAAGDIKEFIFGYGISLRLETSLGIFGVSYALGKGDSLLEGKVHFGLINNF